MGASDRNKHAGTSWLSEPAATSKSSVGVVIDESVTLPGDEISVGLLKHPNDEPLEGSRPSALMLVWGLLLVAFAVMAIGAAASLPTFN